MASFPTLSSGLGLRYRAERIETSLAFRIESYREEKRDSPSSGRTEVGTECMASCTSLGAGLNCSQGALLTGYLALSLAVRGAKYGAYDAAEVKGARTRRVTAPLSLTLQVKERGREQLASRKTEAAMSGK